MASESLHLGKRSPQNWHAQGFSLEELLRGPVVSTTEPWVVVKVQRPYRCKEDCSGFLPDPDEGAEGVNSASMPSSLATLTISISDSPMA